MTCSGLAVSMDVATSAPQSEAGVSELRRVVVRRAAVGAADAGRHAICIRCDPSHHQRHSWHAVAEDEVAGQVIAGARLPCPAHVRATLFRLCLTCWDTGTATSTVMDSCTLSMLEHSQAFADLISKIESAMRDDGCLSPAAAFVALPVHIGVEEAGVRALADVLQRRGSAMPRSPSMLAQELRFVHNTTSTDEPALSETAVDPQYELPSTNVDTYEVPVPGAEAAYYARASMRADNRGAHEYEYSVAGTVPDPIAPVKAMYSVVKRKRDADHNYDLPAQNVTVDPNYAEPDAAFGFSAELSLPRAAHGDSGPGTYQEPSDGQHTFSDEV